MPCLFLAGGVLELEGEDCGAFFDGVFAVFGGGVEGVVDCVEGGGGGEGGWDSVSEMFDLSCCWCLGRGCIVEVWWTYSL